MMVGGIATFLPKYDLGTFEELSRLHLDPVSIALGDGMLAHYPTFKQSLRFRLFVNLGRERPGIFIHDFNFTFQGSSPGMPDTVTWYLTYYFREKQTSFECNQHVRARWQKQGMYAPPRDSFHEFVVDIGSIMLGSLK